ncbi:hypothetical protein [Candidatus Poriferisodalis sp.]|uniref:hypothetical protein n=1 Tax=Candidatus Poriferisodalis sp. TaxID=3101277 RepID=UPI003B5CD1C8
MSSRRRRKTSRTRRLDGAEVQQRQAAEASAAFWHGTTRAAISPEHADAAASSAATTASAEDAAVPHADIGTEARRISVTTDPTSTVRSLGKPPLAGRETVAEHYFEAVYKRAVAMAGALAAAGGLLAPDGEGRTAS